MEPLNCINYGNKALAYLDLYCLCAQSCRETLRNDAAHMNSTFCILPPNTNCIKMCDSIKPQEILSFPHISRFHS